jgi:hypothetical protein
MRNIVVVLGLVVVLASCGGDDSASDSTPLTVPATDMSGAVTVDVAPCDLVTADDVEAATGLTVVAVDDTTLDPTGCVFDLGLSADVFVEIESGQDRFGGPAFLFANYMDSVEDGSAELIPGVGVAAVYSPSFRGLAVDAGQGRFIAVGLNGGYPEQLAEPRQILVDLALAAATRL